MAAPTNEALFLLKDVKPGSKNLNIVFIVLEIGKSTQIVRLNQPPPRPPGVTSVFVHMWTLLAASHANNS